MENYVGATLVIEKEPPAAQLCDHRGSESNDTAEGLNVKSLPNVSIPFHCFTCQYCQVAHAKHLNADVSN